MKLTQKLSQLYSHFTWYKHPTHTHSHSYTLDCGPKPFCYVIAHGESCILPRLATSSGPLPSLPGDELGLTRELLQGRSAGEVKRGKARSVRKAGTPFDVFDYRGLYKPPNLGIVSMYSETTMTGNHGLCASEFGIIHETSGRLPWNCLGGSKSRDRPQPRPFTAR